MRKNLVVVLLVAVMVGAFAGAGQAALFYANSVTGAGVTNATAAVGAPNGDFATLANGGYVDITFGGYFQDTIGTDFVIFFSQSQNLEPVVYASARALDGTWTNLDFVVGASNLRVYEIAGNGTASYDMVRVSWNNSLPVLNGLGGFATASSVAPVPEPGTMMLLGSGLVGLAAYGRKKFRK